MLGSFSILDDLDFLYRPDCSFLLFFRNLQESRVQHICNLLLGLALFVKFGLCAHIGIVSRVASQSSSTKSMSNT